MEAPTTFFSDAWQDAKFITAGMDADLISEILRNFHMSPQVFPKCLYIPNIVDALLELSAKPRGQTVDADPPAPQLFCHKKVRIQAGWDPGLVQRNFKGNIPSAGSNRMSVNGVNMFDGFSIPIYKCV